MKNRWKNFEKIVAAIHKLEAQGAIVAWNEKINGRQFDVTIRFKTKHYEYLTLIECKDYRNPVPIEKLEAFITKSKDALANKAIMVSSSGFQEGAIVAAKKHGIELFTLKEIDVLPQHFLVKGFTPAIQMYDLKLRSEQDDVVFDFPNESGKLTYYLDNMHYLREGSAVKLNSILDEHHLEIDSFARLEPNIFEIPFNETVQIFKPWPYENEVVHASKMTMTVVTISARIIDAKGLDPNCYPKSFEYKNAMSSLVETYKLTDVLPQISDTLKEGAFYYSPSLDSYYLCNKIDDELITMTMLESYQHGKMLQVTFTFKKANPHSYQEVVDEEKILHLQKILSRIAA